MGTGYIIICIIIGAFLGSFIFTWDQLLNEIKYVDDPPMCRGAYSTNGLQQPETSACRCHGLLWLRRVDWDESIAGICPSR